MNIPLSATWEKVRSSLWFVPSLMVAGADVLSVVTVAIDRTIVDAPGRSVLLYGGGADGARALLGAVASSMMTVAGVVFSVTIVALTLASQQFGPRILRNFMNDTGNRVVLGTFIATFVYCLMVVRTVRGGDEITFVPHVSVTVGVGLALASLGVLIYFIHHVATSIQADTVIARIGAELEESVERLYPQQIGSDEAHPETADIPAPFTTLTELRASGEGYLQIVDDEKIIETAAEHDLLLRFHHEPGDFVFEQSLLVEVYSKEVPPEGARDAIVGSFVIGNGRTPAQDVEFTFHQLVQLALRALSPSLNDPFTAMSAIDRITAGFRRLGLRRFPSPLRKDDDEIVRVIARRKSYEDIVISSMRPLLESAAASPVVMHHLKRRLETVAADVNGMRRETIQGAIRQLEGAVSPARPPAPHCADGDRDADQ